MWAAHARVVRAARTLREPPRESFNLMVVGEAGLGKTTLLESFFKSFKDDEAAFALFERKETAPEVETRRQLAEAQVQRWKELHSEVDAKRGTPPVHGTPPPYDDIAVPCMADGRGGGALLGRLGHPRPRHGRAQPAQRALLGGRTAPPTHV